MNIKRTTAFVLIFVMLSSSRLRSQEIIGDTLRVSETIPNMIKFPDVVQSADLLCSKEDYDLKTDEKTFKVKAASGTATSPCSIVITEGGRTHQFILLYESGPISDVYHDYSTVDKLKARIALLDSKKAKPIATAAPTPDQSGAAVAPDQVQQQPVQAEPSLVSASDPSLMVLGALTIKRVDFEKRVTDKLELLGKDMTILINKANPMTERNRTVDAAMNLFNNDTSRRVQVTNSQGQKINHPVKSYLNKLKLLNYEKPDVTIGNIQFISNLTLQPDGSYKGYVQFIQVFKGVRGDKTPYMDKTEKTAEITIKVWDEIKDGVEQKRWDVYLGNINVTDTQKK